MKIKVFKKKARITLDADGAVILLDLLANGWLRPVVPLNQGDHDFLDKLDDAIGGFARTSKLCGRSN